MQHISKAINLPEQQQGQPKPSKESRICDENLLRKIFATFSVVYGASWDKNLATDELTSITKQVWITGLKGLTRDEIERGLENLQGTFAVNPQTFAGWCKDSNQGLTHNTAAYSRFDKSRAIEKKPDLEIARAGMAGIKAKLGMAL